MTVEFHKELSEEDRIRTAGIITTTVIVSVIANIAVALRMATRKWIVRSIGWDDWTMVMADFGITVSSGLVIVQAHYGFGRHAGDLTVHEFREFQKYSYGEWLQTFATLMLTKISICLFLLRITISKAFIRPLQAMIAMLLVSNIIITFLWLVQCRPSLAAAWDSTITGSKCMSVGQLRAIILAQAIISVLSDFTLAAFPILILRKVQINLRLKVGLCCLMGLGVITGSICLARTVLNNENVNGDPTWVSVQNWHLRSWEVCIGIVAASIPAIHPGYRWLRGKRKAQESAPSPAPYSLPKKGGLGGTTVFDRARFPRSRSEHTTTATKASADEGFVPLQDFEIRKTTTVDVERDTSHRNSSRSQDYPGVMRRMDSETRLKNGAGTPGEDVV
ncbi:hypothetical protein MMC20_005485 [Loxospora ochrophaea]|nr:hypothetical protein [Loxospora ochrophaea]